ncbi:hypothetical protein ACIBCR_18085 [Micromonospora echinospora]|uniref:hypothetical protein n=1 Tax=Micromonospora echinospora TaxID=1877 RepID=UPI003793CC51
MRAHRTDLLSLTFGLLFLAAAAWWLLAQLLGLVVPIGWFLAGALVVVGVLGLLGALRAARSSADTGPTAGSPGSPPPAPGVPLPGGPADPDRPSDGRGEVGDSARRGDGDG